MATILLKDIFEVSITTKRFVVKNKYVHNCVITCLTLVVNIKNKENKKILVNDNPVFKYRVTVYD